MNKRLPSSAKYLESRTCLQIEQCWSKKFVTPATILNVDDNEAGRYARNRLLVKAGYTVRDAGTGTEALELLFSVRPTLAILDVNLPDISGLEVCRRIKTDPLTARTPVLQLSASAITAADCVGGLDNGADTYLTEPVDSGVLLATIRALLRMRDAEEELHKANEALSAANAALVRSNNDLERFAHIVSHDLQAPLTTVSSFASLLDLRYRGKLDRQAGTFLDHIRNGTERMSSLVERLLIYAQAGGGHEDIRDHVEMQQVLAWAVSNLEQAISASGASVTHDLLPSVRGDQTLLAQLLQNLISNGLKYRRAEEPARVHVTAEEQPHNTVLFSVSDNGIGISPEYHKQIFEEFSRLHGQEVGGTGIGLATCQRIVEHHGGRIWVESAGPGNGATFRFLLPST
jgi:two-component system, sensor histidine kinase and response regulator